MADDTDCVTEWHGIQLSIARKPNPPSTCELSPSLYTAETTRHFLKDIPLLPQPDRQSSQLPGEKPDANLRSNCHHGRYIGPGVDTDIVIANRPLIVHHCRDLLSRIRLAIKWILTRAIG